MYLFELLYIIPSRSKNDEDRCNKFLLIKSIIDLVDNGDIDIDNDVLDLFEKVVYVADAVSVDFPNALQDLSDIGLYPEVIKYVYCDFAENEIEPDDSEILVLPPCEQEDKDSGLNMMHFVCAAFSVLLLASPAVVSAIM